MKSSTTANVECFFKSAFVQTQLTIRFIQSYEIGERCDCENGFQQILLSIVGVTLNLQK